MSSFGGPPKRLNIQFGPKKLNIIRKEKSILVNE